MPLLAGCAAVPRRAGADAGIGGRLPVEEEVTSSLFRAGASSCPFTLSRRLMSRPPAPGMPGRACPGRAGMVAVRAADLAWPGGLGGPGTGGRPALVTPGTGRIRTGDMVVFCRPVAVARAVVRRDGRVQAAGHPADHARLGWPRRLDEMTGTPGVIDGGGGGGPEGEGQGRGAAGDDVGGGDPVQPADDADGGGRGYGEVMAALFGDLAAGAVAAPVSAPTATVAGHLAGGERRGAGAAAAGHGAGGVDAEHERL